MTTTYIIYYTEHIADKTPKSIIKYELGEALKVCEELRKRAREGEHITHITMAVEDTNMVGEHGVDSIVDGKTPDGVEYTWRKRRP